jgi:hypothetical protein
MASLTAQRLIDDNLHLFAAVPLTADDYKQAIACMVSSYLAKARDLAVQMARFWLS